MTFFPALFIGHGSPMNALSDNNYTQHLKKLGKNFPEPKAIVVISAHWLTNGTFVTVEEHPEQIYDFYGFPQKLYEIPYKPVGSPFTADLVIELGKSKKITGSKKWGIDHAAWSVLCHMFPSANIPVVEVSIDLNMPPEYHYELGKILQNLRKEEILVIGSGNLVHNLVEMDYNTEALPYDWVVEADSVVKQLLLKEDLEGLYKFPHLNSFGHKAVPSPDHYYPVFYILGIKQDNEKVNFTFEGFQNGSISMRSFIVS